MSNGTEWPEMGNGNVAVGECFRMGDQVPGLIYLKLDEPRAIGADTSDAYPVGEPAPEGTVLACVYFRTAEAIQQTIDVLQEMKRSNFKD